MRVPGERPEEERETGSPVPGAITEGDLHVRTRYRLRPNPPATGQLLADLGMDADAVRETLADDLARRCPDHEVLEHIILPDAVPPGRSESRASRK